jgi:DNA-directed RNA polymerase subunit RPC12/RpoP
VWLTVKPRTSYDGRDMAIRFQCSGCSQPIEVDDEWASRAVVCPYCRRTVTAPGSSTLGDISTIPTARSALAGDETREFGHPAGASPAQAGYAGRNTLAVVAAILMGLMLIQLVAVSVIARAHAEEINTIYQHIEESTQQGGDPFTASQKALAELSEASGGGIPDWYLGMILLFLGAALCWIAGVIFAGIAVTRPVGRRLAGWTIAVACIAPIYFCCMGGLL